MIVAGIKQLVELETAGKEAKLVDLLRALQFMPRFAGHVKRPFSVLQHCIHGALALRSMSLHKEPDRIDKESDALMRAFVVHDVAEAFTGDVPRPIKPDAIRDIERRVMTGFLTRTDLVNVNGEALERVKKLDSTITAEEAQFFELPGWHSFPDLAALPRPEVWNAIKEVAAIARKNRSQSFGVPTLAPARLAKWLTQKNDEKINFEWAMYGLQHTEY